METTAVKPVGGFVFVSATGLLAAWWAYKRRFIQFRDFRAWLACHELLAERCALEQGQVAHFEVKELGRFVGGVGGEHLRASVRRLEQAGLMAWSQTNIQFANSVSDVRVGEPDDLAEKVHSVTNHRRRVPVARRLLKLLARESRPVFVATALGHLLRCMYYRNCMCRGNGLCKASWIAGVFEVDKRNVKAARHELVGLKVLFRQSVGQRLLNEEGVPMCFNFRWGEYESNTPSLRELSTTETPPPIRTGNSSFGRSENQNSETTDPTGVRKRTVPEPDWRHIIPDDLTNPARLDSLWRQSLKTLARVGTESARLNFFSAASHARRIATRNSCGVFATVIRRNLYGFISQADEDAGRLMMGKAGSAW